MHTLDLARLNERHGERGVLATVFDRAARAGERLRLDNHGLDTELLDYVQAHGRALLKQPELHEAYLDQRRAMMGVAQRLLRIAGSALRSDASYFVDHYSGEPRAELLVLGQRPSHLRSGTRGLLGLGQNASGAVTAWVGPQLAELSGRRYRTTQRLGPHQRDSSPGEPVLVLDFASPLATFRNVDMPNRRHERALRADRSGYEPGRNVMSNSRARAYSRCGQEAETGP